MARPRITPVGRNGGIGPRRHGGHGEEMEGGNHERHEIHEKKALPENAPGNASLLTDEPKRTDEKLLILRLIVSVYSTKRVQAFRANRVRRPKPVRAEGPTVRPAKGDALVIGSPGSFPFSTIFQPSAQRAERFASTTIGSARRYGEPNSCPGIARHTSPSRHQTPWTLQAALLSPLRWIRSPRVCARSQRLQ